MKFIGNTKEYLHLATITQYECFILKEVVESSLTILWFEDNDNQLTIDGKDYVFHKNQIAFLTEFHKVVVKKIGRIMFLRFNRPFFCISDHDGEVGCKGILFFGASRVPVISIPENEIEKMEVMWKAFLLEMDSADNLQIDMLQMMLKRYLILCTRIYKTQNALPEKEVDYDIQREFNYLIEHHFKTKHTVAEYAELLFKSPKTISNIFSKVGSKTPLHYIHDRKMLEARRLLHYSDKSIKEIAYEIGYQDIQTFSRFFKKQEGVSPKEFKESKHSGTIANS